ncbi:MAG: bifunctional DNA primase/polymerase, partial [Planctomycetaceae bacterium]|nr:bifunctional DNA primase/polymerase [Planctomycetaceae bacterium]
MQQPTTIDAALACIARGWCPVPVPHGSKGPLIPGWQKLRIAGDDADRHFAGDANIGVLLGEPSGWLVDVDLDCEEAREAADRFLPPTACVTGRASSKASHRWYVAHGARTRQFRDPVDRSMVVELRSTGAQTIVGPSVHPSGERYDMLEGIPATVDAEELEACVQRLADHVVARRHRIAEPVGQGGAADDEHVERRAIAYLDRMPPAISGSGGHAATYAAATALVHGFGIAPPRALALLVAHYNPRCQPPWSEAELAHKVNDAERKPHSRPYGWLRDERKAADLGVDLSNFSLCRDAAEDDDEEDRIAPPRALAILREHYNHRCEPAWTEAELSHKVND